MSRRESGPTDCHRENGDTESNQEVGQDVTSLVRAGDRDRRDIGYVVQAAVNDEGRGANPNRRADVEANDCVS